MWFRIISLGYAGHEQERTKKCFHHVLSLALHWNQDYFHATWQLPCQVFQRLLTFIIIHNFLFLQITPLLLQDYQTDRLQLSSQKWKDRKQKCFKSNSGTGLTHLSTPQQHTKNKNIMLEGVFKSWRMEEENIRLVNSVFLSPSAPQMFFCSTPNS